MAVFVRAARFCIRMQANSALFNQPSNNLSKIFGFMMTKDNRMWQSTQVAAHKFVSDDNVATKVDTMIDSAQRFVQQYRRISYKQLEPILLCLENEGSISVTSSVAILNFFGSVMYDVTPDNRSKLVDLVWEKLIKRDVPLQSVHYNTLLAIYNQNRLKYSPTEFLATLESKGVTPNRVTFQRLIARFCDDGDITGATHILEHMKNEQMPINEQVFNAFIMGHLRANDPDSARNVLNIMRESNLEPSSSTYASLAIGFAERGDVQDMVKYIREAESENNFLRASQLLQVYVTLVHSGHQEHIDEVLSFLRSVGAYGHDAVRVINQLIGDGCDDEAYKLYREIALPIAEDDYDNSYGRFILRAFAIHKRPVEKVSPIMKDMLSRQLTRCDFSTLAHIALLESLPGYALSVIEQMKAEHMPVRAHYFWPVICQFGEIKDCDGIEHVMEMMVKLCDFKDEFLTTTHKYIIPALVNSGKSEEQILASLKSLQFPEYVDNFAYFLYLLESKPAETSEFLERHRVVVVLTALRVCLMRCAEFIDGKELLLIVAKLRASCDEWKSTLIAATFPLIKKLLITQQRDSWLGLSDTLNIMRKHELRVIEEDEVKFRDLLKDAPSELTGNLDDFIFRYDGHSSVKDDSGRTLVESIDFGDLLSRDMSLEFVQEMLDENPENIRLQMYYVVKACALGVIHLSVIVLGMCLTNLSLHEYAALTRCWALLMNTVRLVALTDAVNAEDTRARLESKNAIFPQFVLCQLIYLHANFTSDLDKALSYFKQLRVNYPSFQCRHVAILKLATLLHASDRTTEAIELLQGQADMSLQLWKEWLQKQNAKLFENIVQMCDGVESARKMSDMLISIGAPCLPALNAFFDKVLESGDPDYVLDEFMNVVQTHNVVPRVDQVLCFFIQKEDPENLQKVVDRLSTIYGMMNVFHHLIAGFVECGHVRKARKVIETPGLRARMDRLNSSCDRFIKDKKFKELEIFIDITKELFGLDREQMLFNLIRGYVADGDLRKAEDMLLQYEDEMLHPSDRTLRYLANALQSNDLPVKFSVPMLPPSLAATQLQDSDDIDGGTVGDADAPAVSRLAGQLKQLIITGDLAGIQNTLQGGESGLLQAALRLMKPPWPARVLQAVFRQLAEQGDFDQLSCVSVGFSRSLMREHTACLLLAAVKSGRPELEDLIDQVVSPKANYCLTIPVVAALHEMSPKTFDRLQQKAVQVMKEFNNLEPISVIWAYYRLSKSPSADKIMAEIPQFAEKVLVGSFCAQAHNNRNVEELEHVLGMKREVGQAGSMSLVYSRLLRLHEDLDDVAAVEETYKRGIDDGIIFHTPTRRAAESYLLSKGRKLPESESSTFKPIENSYAAEPML